MPPFFAVSEDGQKFDVKKAIACQSVLVQTLTAEEGSSNLRAGAARVLQCPTPPPPLRRAGTGAQVPLTGVKATVLAKVIEFMTHHVENRLPEIEKVRIEPDCEPRLDGGSPRLSEMPHFTHSRLP